MAVHPHNTPSGVHEPGLPGESGLVPQNDTPIDIEAVIHHLAMRPQEAEAFVAGLAHATVEQMDRLEPDPDFEQDVLDQPHDAEPDEETLGWSAVHSQMHLGNNTADGDVTALERHGMGFLRSGPEDAEPWLGSPEISASCSVVCLVDGRWCSVRSDQTTWAKGANDDREEQDEDGTEIDRGELGDDNGIADRDGASEQWNGHVAGGLYVE